MNYTFEQVDVFTQRRFAGNPLAVFTDGQGLSPTDMQSIAREMNLSETTFVVPPTRADCVAKYFIFTPDRELPFAGHPTVGTAFVLARSGLVPQGSNVLNLEAQVGKVLVRIEGATRNPTSLFFTSPPVEFAARFEKNDHIASALGVQRSDLLEAAPIEEAGCPLMHPYVGLRSVEAVDSVAVNPQLLRQALNRPNGVYVFAMPAPGRIYSRFFFGSGFAGMIEDPATGSAASPLGAYLVRNGLLNGGEAINFVVEQGTHMGRQSFLNVTVRRSGQHIEKIEVGGSAVPVLTGTLVV